MSQTPVGVVIDQPLTEALLFAAVQERLVADNPSIGDGFVAQLLQRPPARELIEAAFEQLVVGGAALTPFWLPPRWSGELFESGAMSEVADIGADTVLEFSSLPADVVLGMLRARGLPWDETKLMARCQCYLDAYRAWETVAEGKSYDAVETRMALRGITKDELVDYTPEQLATWKSVQGARDDVKPVLECIDAYRRVLSASLEAKAISSVPVVPSTFKVNEAAALPSGAELVKLFRITCKALRRVPIAATLRETLQIAQSAEAAALRSQLLQWVTAAREQKVDAAEIALAEVERARRALSGARRAAKVGEYATWIGLPVSIAGAFVSGPIGAAAGIAISGAGTAAVATQKAVQYLNRWAMFGAE